VLVHPAWQVHPLVAYPSHGARPARISACAKGTLGGILRPRGCVRIQPNTEPILGQVPDAYRQYREVFS